MDIKDKEITRIEIYCRYDEIYYGEVMWYGGYNQTEQKENDFQILTIMESINLNIRS